MHCSLLKMFSSLFHYNCLSIIMKIATNLLYFVMLINKRIMQNNPSFNKRFEPLLFNHNQTHFVSFVYLLRYNNQLCRIDKDAKKVHVYMLYICLRNKVWVIPDVIKRKICTHSKTTYFEFTQYLFHDMQFHLVEISYQTQEV